MSVFQMLKTKIGAFVRPDLKLPLVPVIQVPTTTGDGNCGYNALAIEIVANAKNPKLKQAFQASPNYWNTLINYLYQVAHLSRTKHDPYEAFQEYLKNVKGLHQREKQIAFALRELFANDLFSLIPIEVMQEYFLAATIDYFAKQLQIVNQERFKGDDTFCQIPAIQSYLTQFYNDHRAQMPQPGVTMAMLQDILLPPLKEGQVDTSLGGQLKQFWQNHGHRMYRDYVAQNGNWASYIELTSVAHHLQCNLSIIVRGNSLPFTNVVDCVGPVLHLGHAPGHWNALVMTAEQNEQINTTTISKPAPVIMPTPAISIPPKPMPTPTPAPQPRPAPVKKSEELSNSKSETPAPSEPNVPRDVLEVINNEVNNFFDHLSGLKISEKEKADSFNDFFEKSIQTCIEMTNTDKANRFNLFKNYHNAWAGTQFNNVAGDNIAASINEVLNKVALVK